MGAGFQVKVFVWPDSGIKIFFLVKKFEQANLPIIWSNLVRVVTSSRLDARADEGFAHFLRGLENQPLA